MVPVYLSMYACDALRMERLPLLGLAVPFRSESTTFPVSEPFEMVIAASVQLSRTTFSEPSGLPFSTLLFLASKSKLLGIVFPLLLPLLNATSGRLFQKMLFEIIHVGGSDLGTISVYLALAALPKEVVGDRATVTGIRGVRQCEPSSPSAECCGLTLQLWNQFFEMTERMGLSV
jgi:hypothetical protein